MFISEQVGLGQRVKWLIACRLAIASVLLISTLILRPGEDSDFLGTSYLAMLTITSGYLLVAFVFGVIYLSRKIRNLRRFAFIQIFWDLVFITLLVYISGGIDSRFKFMYWLTIINASFLLFRTGAYMAAALSSVFYGTLANLMYLRRLPVFFDIVDQAGNWQENTVIGSIFLNALVFGAVAYVSGYVSGHYREAETQLAEKTLEIEDLEALMGRIVESLTSGLVTVDSGGKINYWNGTAVRITGLSAPEVFGRPFGEIFPGIQAGLSSEEAEDENELRPWREEMEFVDPNGEQKILGFSVTGLRHGEREKKGKLVIFQDLTDFRRMEDRVKRADRLAVVGELAASMAHEIRNPLTSMSAAIEVLKDEAEVKPEDRRLMNIVVRETDRLNQLLTDFLIFARPAPPHFEEVPLDSVVRETAELFSRSRESKQAVELETDLAPDVRIRGDSKQLCQMVWNVVKNAAEAMDHQGKVKISLACDSDTKKISVSIQDQGPGIPAPLRAKVFQPFYTTKTKGTGLGLAVVHRIAEEHGGSVMVEENENGGATVRVVFPELISTTPEVGET